MNRRMVFVGAAFVLAATLSLVWMLRDGNDAGRSELESASPERQDTGGQVAGAESRSRSTAPFPLERAPPAPVRQSPRPHEAPVASGQARKAVPLDHMPRMNAGELIATEPGMVRLVQAGITRSVGGTLRECVSEFRNGFEPGKQPVLRHTIVLAVSARDGEAVVREALGDEGWPEGFTPPLQDCLTRSFTGVRFPVDRDFDYRIEYPLVIR